MKFPPSVKAEFAYARDLVEAGLDTAGDRTSMPSLASVSQSALAPAVIGAVVGIVGICLTQRKRSGQSAVLGGLIGCALGFSGGVVWCTRDHTSSVARTAFKRVQAVRDARWLEKNPISYA